VAFQRISLADALAKAKSESKFIFLQLESPTCSECTEVAEKGLSDNSLSKMINESFVPLYINADHKDRKEIENMYNSPNGFGTLFIDQNGTLIHKFPSTTTMSSKYKEQIEIAFNKAGENVRVSELEKQYLNGNKSLGFLEQLMLKKRELNLDNTFLLDEYVSLLPTDSLTSISTLQFLASMYPVLGSRADFTLRRDTALFNKAWYQIALDKRVNLNSRIIYNSLNKAILEKDENYALRVARFARGTTTSTKEAAERAYFMRLAEFYDRTDNTTKYLTTAATYYDNYLMTVDPDSIKKVDEVLKGKMLQTAKKDTVRTETGYTVRALVGYSPTTQRYTGQLKEGAWNFYKKTSDPELLAKATSWVKRGLEFYESDEALNVYAHLLYKQGQKDEAIKIEKQVIELKKKRGLTAKDNEAILAKMEIGQSL